MRRDASPTPGAIQKVRTLSRGEGGTQKAYKSVQGEGGSHAGMYVRSQRNIFDEYLSYNVIH